MKDYDLTGVSLWTKKEINKFVSQNKGLEIRVDNRTWKIEWKSIGAGLYRVRFRCVACYGNFPYNEFRDIADRSLMERELKW